MKCGIITFHRAVNYGGVLQAYALQEYINKNVGVDCEIIDYRCENIENMYKYRLSSYNPKAIVKYLYKFPTNSKKKKLFNKFIKKYIKKGKSLQKSELKTDSDKYDVIITGSDQVWGQSRINVDHSYFLDFVKDSKKKASYAASFGTKEIRNSLEEEYRKLLGDFSHISVREKSGADIVKKLTDRTAEVSIDPTFLLDKEQWEKIASDNLKGKKYLLIYTLTNSKSVIDIARKIAKEKGLIIYNISDAVKEEKGIKNLKAISPEEWVGAFMNASYVVTNSFHGTAFSINFNKNFNAEVSSGIAARGNRITDLLDLLGLSDRLINDGENSTDIVYDDVNKVICEERKKSEDYLKKIFG